MVTCERCSITSRSNLCQICKLELAGKRMPINENVLYDWLTMLLKNTSRQKRVLYVRKLLVEQERTYPNSLNYIGHYYG